MDYYNNEQLYHYFENEIKKSAAEQTEQLKKEIADQRDKELSKIQKELKESIDSAAELEIKELQVDHSYEINRIISENSRSLIKRRQELLENVFAEAKIKLAKFVFSKDYGKLIESKLQNIVDKFSDYSVIFRIKPDDQILLGILQSTYKHPFTVQSDSEISIGGFSVICEQLGIEMNETLDQRFNEQKEWFYANSNLYVK